MSLCLRVCLCVYINFYAAFQKFPCQAFLYVVLVFFSIGHKERVLVNCTIVNSHNECLCECLDCLERPKDIKKKKESRIVRGMFLFFFLILVLLDIINFDFHVVLFPS